VDDRRSGIALQHPSGDESGNRAPAHCLGLIVDEECTVRVTIECNAEVMTAVGDHLH